MWVTADYEAATLFSLKYSTATSSGGKTLLVPTPFAIKMALLDSACRTAGVAQAQAWWEMIRDLRVAVRPPEHVVVSNIFQKILRPRRNPAAPGDADSGPFQRTIGYREYAQWKGAMSLALGWEGEDERPWLQDLLLNIHYLGKRGGFVQLVHFPQVVRELPAGFVDLTREADEFPIHGMLQVLDDCSPGMTFDQANIYSPAKIRMGRERITRSVVLPYRLVKSSKSFSLYERSL